MKGSKNSPFVPIDIRMFLCCLAHSYRDVIGLNGASSHLCDVLMCLVLFFKASMRIIRLIDKNGSTWQSIVADVVNPALNDLNFLSILFCLSQGNSKPQLSWLDVPLVYDVGRNISCIGL